MEDKMAVEELENEVVRLRKELEETKSNYQNQVKNIKENEARIHKHEELLRSVVEAAAGKIGQDFFDNIVSRLSGWLGAECVLIGRMVEQERIEAVPLYLDGKISHGFSYNLKGSPCAITTRKGYCCFTENVIEEFPDDQILVDLNAKAYIGSALYNEEGETCGVICAVSRNELEVPPFANEILAIIGSRVTAEIERQKTEEALKLSQKQLLESNITKDKFFSLIAHDLKSPLNAIAGFSELLMRNFDTHSRERLKKYVDQLYKASNKTISLVNNLLTWSLSQRGMIEYQEKSLPLNRLIQDAISLLHGQALKKNVSVILDVDSKLEIVGDENMLSTVFRNLISNAIKYSKTDSRIEVYAKNDAEHGQVHICVEDFGVGMSPDQLKHLFQIEVNTTTPGTDSEEGTGLGLIICKEFIEMHGGEIKAESTEGKGSKFYFALKEAK